MHTLQQKQLSTLVLSMFSVKFLQQLMWTLTVWSVILSLKLVITMQNTALQQNLLGFTHHWSNNLQTLLKVSMNHLKFVELVTKIHLILSELVTKVWCLVLLSMKLQSLCHFQLAFHINWLKNWQICVNLVRFYTFVRMLNLRLLLSMMRMTNQYVLIQSLSQRNTILKQLTIKFVKTSLKKSLKQLFQPNTWMTRQNSLSTQQVVLLLEDLKGTLVWLVVRSLLILMVVTQDTVVVPSQVRMPLRLTVQLHMRLATLPKTS